MLIKRKQFRDFDSNRLIYEWVEELVGNQEVFTNNENEKSKIAEAAVDKGRKVEGELLAGQSNDAKKNADAALLSADAALLKIMDRPGFDKEALFDEHINELRKTEVVKNVKKSLNSDFQIREVISGLLKTQTIERLNPGEFDPMFVYYTFDDLIASDPVLTLAIENIPFENGRFSLNNDYIEGIAKALNIPNDETNTLRYRMSILFKEVEDKNNQYLTRSVS